MWRSGAGIGWRWWLAVRGVQVRAAGSLAGVASLGAVPASAPDREQHAVSGAAGGVGRAGLGVAGAVAESAAAERGLAGGARPSAGAGGDVRGPVAVPRNVLSGVELDAGGSDAGFRAAQRPVHGRARFEQGDVRSPVAPGRAGAAGGRGGAPRVGFAEGVVGVVADGRAALAAGPVRGVAGLPARPGEEAPAGDGAVAGGAGAAVGAFGAGGGGALREGAVAGGAGGARGVAEPAHGEAGGAVGLDVPPGDGGHRP